MTDEMAGLGMEGLVPKGPEVVSYTYGTDHPF